MPKHTLFVFLLASVAIMGCATDNGTTLRQSTGWTAPLDDLGFTASIQDLPRPHNWRVKQVSSFDPTGGNRDDAHGHQVYDGGVVLADLEGPGVVTRIWTREPIGSIYIYVDDLEHPILAMPFKDMFDGGLEYWSPGFNLFGEPFVGQGSGGYYSYVPIPYEEHCRIIVATDEKTLPYQVTYAELPEETPLKSFELALTPDDVRFFKQWVKNWKEVSLRWPKSEETIHHSRHNYWPEDSALLFAVEGPATMTEIELITHSADPDALDKLWIAVFYDGQEDPGVLAPLGDFFGAATKDSSDYNSLVIGKYGNRMWCRYPMPFREEAQIYIISTSSEVADIEYFVTWQDGQVDDGHYFFARYNSALTEKGVPYSVANIKGKGHYVGTTIAVEDAQSLTFLEGDDVYLVDGEPAAEFHGTGTDDYFNAGWYFADGSHSSPTHSATVKKTSSPAGFAAFRSHITEPVPFHHSFEFELEHGPNNDRPGVQYTSVSYWYQQDNMPADWPISALDGVELRKKP